MNNTVITGDPANYRAIARILNFCFVINGIALAALNTSSGTAWISSLVGDNAHFVQLFFWGCIGATIAGSRFLAYDKELNEIESMKPEKEKRDVRYPDSIDVWLYAQRILSSGILAIFAAVVVIAGLGYFDAPINQVTTKHRMFFVVLSVLIGLFENRFLASLEKLSKRLFRHHGSSKN